jgi:hypothetical protein
MSEGPRNRDDGSDSDRLPESLSDASNVLVLGSIPSAADRSVCRALLTRRPPASSNVLLVSLTGGADERLRALEAAAGRLPANVAVVSTRERADSTTTMPGDVGTDITVETVSDPADLPKLGMNISRVLGEWEGEQTTSVCFDSLTALLQYADRRRVFQFVQVLQDRAESLGGLTHYHMDPEAHDDRTIATMRSLFDAIVEPSPDGDHTVRGQP